MALREVAPFSEEQWDLLMKLQKREPSEQAKKFFKEARKMAKELGLDMPEQV